MHERIKRVREEIAGMSQRAFAQRIGITGSSIALLESGKTTPASKRSAPSAANSISAAHGWKPAKASLSFLTWKTT